MLVLVGLLMPVAEFFDRWDAPGPGGDSELPLFSIVLALCAVLLVCYLMARLSLHTELRRWWIRRTSDALQLLRGQHEASMHIPPISPPPLRI